MARNALLVIFINLEIAVLREPRVGLWERRACAARHANYIICFFIMGQLRRNKIGTNSRHVDGVECDTRGAQAIWYQAMLIMPSNCLYVQSNFMRQIDVFSTTVITIHNSIKPFLSPTNKKFYTFFFIFSISIIKTIKNVIETKIAMTFFLINEQIKNEGIF